MLNYCVVDSLEVDKALSLYFLEIINKSFPDYNFTLLDINSENFPINGNVYLCYDSSYGRVLNKACDSKRITKSDLFLDGANIKSLFYICKFNFDLNLISEIPKIKKDAWLFLKNIVLPNIILIENSLVQNKEELINSNKEIIVEPEPLIKEDVIHSNENILISEEDSSIEEEEYSMSDFYITIDDIFNEFSLSKIKSKNKSFDNFPAIEIFNKEKTESIVVTNNSRLNICNKISFSDFALVVKSALLIGSTSIKFFKRNMHS